MKWFVRGVVFGVGCAIGYAIGYELQGHRLKKLEKKNKQLEEDRKKALFAIVQAKTRVRGLREAIERLESKEESI